MTEKKYYSEIPVLYFIATLFVTVLHIVQYSSFESRILHTFAYIYAAAVPLFLCIAGFLACNRTIMNPKVWLWHKIKRIYFPYALIMLPVMIYYSFSGGEAIFKWVMLLLGLQGTQNYFIVRCDFYIAPTGLGHFWYVSIILICFTIVALGSWIVMKRQKKSALMRISKKRLEATEEKNNIRFYLFLICSIVAQFILVYVHITIVYIMAFFIGYIMAKWEFRFDSKNMIIISIFAIISLAVRVGVQRVADASILYDFVIAPIQTMLAGIWFFVAVFFLRNKKPILIDKISANPIIKFVSRCVFEIYLIHSITLDGKINVFQFFDNEILANTVALVITVIAAYAVNTLVKYINGVKTRRVTMQPN